MNLHIVTRRIEGKTVLMLEDEFGNVLPNQVFVRTEQEPGKAFVEVRFAIDHERVSFGRPPTDTILAGGYTPPPDKKPPAPAKAKAEFVDA